MRRFSNDAERDGTAAAPDTAADNNHNVAVILVILFIDFVFKYYYCPLNFKDSKNVWLER